MASNRDEDQQARQQNETTINYSEKLSHRLDIVSPQNDLYFQDSFWKEREREMKVKVAP